MTIDRRAFVRSASGLVGLLAMSGAAWASRGGDPPKSKSSKPDRSQDGSKRDGGKFAAGKPRSKTMFFEWSDLRNGVKLATASATGIGAGVLIGGKDQAILIDASTSAFGAALKREAEGRGSRITRVINSSAWENATGGNHVFREQNQGAGDAAHVEILAHERARERIQSQLGRYIAQVKEGIVAIKDRPADELPQVRAEIKKAHDQFASFKADQFLPTKTVKEPISISNDGRPVKVIPVGPAWSDTDLIVHLADDNIVHVGLLVWPGVHPVIDRGEGTPGLSVGGASIAGWVTALEQARALCDDKTIVISSLGERGDLETIKAQLEYFEKLKRIVVYAKDVESMPRADVTKLQTGAFNGLEETGRLKRNLGAMFDEIQQLAQQPK